MLNLIIMYLLQNLGKLFLVKLCLTYLFCFLTYLLLFLISVLIFLYLFCTVGLITAMLLAFITTVIPTYLYSGFLYPVSSMELSGQIVSRFIPATYFLEVVRGIYFIYYYYFEF